MNVCLQKYQQLAIDAVLAHPLNPNVGKLSAIAESIDKSGFYGAIVVQKSTRFILAGNHRWLAARNRGDESLPAIVVDVDDDTASRIMLADNRTADLAVYDDSSLLDLLSEIRREEKNLSGTGYKDSDLDALIAKLTPKEPKPAKESGVKEKPDEDSSIAGGAGGCAAGYKLCVRCQSSKTRISLARRFKKAGYKVENG